jgi:hypothetical protein
VRRALTKSTELPKTPCAGLTRASMSRFQVLESMGGRVKPGHRDTVRLVRGADAIRRFHRSVVTYVF